MQKYEEKKTQNGKVIIQGAHKQAKMDVVDKINLSTVKNI